MLLLAMPSAVFVAVVPWLLLMATALFVLHEPLVSWLRRRQGGAGAESGVEGRRPSAWGVGVQVLVGIYGGYFGAGIGIMMLASLSLLGLRDINRLNALKALLAFLVNMASVIYFLIHGHVDWSLAVWLMAGSVPGSIVGAKLAQRIPARWVRLIAATIGIIIAVSLWLK
jgi:hypothetical protein